MSIVEKGVEFANRKHKFITTSDRIIASREAKALVLEINQLYKETKDSKLMELMKEITVVKQRIDKRLKGRPLEA